MNKAAYEHLRKVDPVLGRFIENVGMIKHKPRRISCFESLVRAITNQQLKIALGHYMNKFHVPARDIEKTKNGFDFQDGSGWTKHISIETWGKSAFILSGIYGVLYFRTDQSSVYVFEDYDEFLQSIQKYK